MNVEGNAKKCPFCGGDFILDLDWCLDNKILAYTCKDCKFSMSLAAIALSGEDFYMEVDEDAKELMRGYKTSW